MTPTPPPTRRVRPTTRDPLAAAYDSTGYGGDGAVESQRAGYLADDTLEEADLIRDYSLEIRENEDE